MVTITGNSEGQTVLTTFEVTPATCDDVLDELHALYDHVVSHHPGFIAAALHVNDARTRIANYSQWRRREDFQAMLRTPEARQRNRVIADLCRSFEPVMMEVAGCYEYN